ncbi:hypothetical protein [Kitasatospora sp. MBT66]|uniref:hypothetical protein n=1 Tax=Kitasatospora sp. MBT66 TaxID=1444769 RepID=UPI0005BE9590|nr:hypothetical protein [Kitasatospora sp. MBT66]
MHVIPEPLKVMDLPRSHTFGYAAPGTVPHVALVDDPERRALCDPDTPLTPDWALNGDPLCPACAPLVQP